jgi:hypothetical protein
MLLLKERGMADSSRKNHLRVLQSFFKTASKRLEVLDSSLDLDGMRFREKVPSRNYLTRRETDLLLSTIERQATNDTIALGDERDVPEARRGAIKRALTARAGVQGRKSIAPRAPAFSREEWTRGGVAPPVPEFLRSNLLAPAETSNDVLRFSDTLPMRDRNGFVRQSGTELILTELRPEAVVY